MTIIINVAFAVSLAAAAFAYMFFRRNMKRLTFFSMCVSTYASGFCGGIALISSVNGGDVMMIINTSYVVSMIIAIIGYVFSRLGFDRLAIGIVYATLWAAGFCCGAMLMEVCHA